MSEVKEFLQSVQGVHENGLTKSVVDFVFTKVDIFGEGEGNTEGVPIHCGGAHVDIRDLGGYILMDLTFPTTTSMDMRMVYSYLEDYANDLNELTEDSKVVPEVAFFISNDKSEDYYILLANPLFWAWNSSTNRGDFDTIRVVFEEEKYGLFKEGPLED